MRNEMMHRPVLKDEVLDLVRNRQNKVSGTLGEIQAQATIDNVAGTAQLRMTTGELAHRIVRCVACLGCVWLLIRHCVLPVI